MAVFYRGLYIFGDRIRVYLFPLSAKHLRIFRVFYVVIIGGSITTFRGSGYYEA